MKLQMKLGAVSGLLALLIPAVISCNGVNSAGDIKEQIIDPRWTEVSYSTFGSYDIRAIAYGGGKFVAVGGGSKVAYSTDGVTWTATGDPQFGTTVLYAIAYGNGRFVAWATAAWRCTPRTAA